MTAKDKTIDFCINYLAELLTIRGYTFKKSNLCFTKEISTDFYHTINIHLDKWNDKSTVRFWTSYSIASKRYKNWFEQTYAIKVNSAALYGSMDWNIEGWEYPSFLFLKGDKFDISSTNKYNKTASFLINKIDNIAIPFLVKHSNWEFILSYHIEGKIYSTAFDLLLMLNKEQEAKKVLIKGIEYWKNNNWDGRLGEKEDVEMRQKLFLE